MATVPLQQCHCWCSFVHHGGTGGVGGQSYCDVWDPPDKPARLPKIQSGAKLCEMAMLTIMVIGLAKSLCLVIVRFIWVQFGLKKICCEFAILRHKNSCQTPDCRRKVATGRQNSCFSKLLTLVLYVFFIQFSISQAINSSSWKFQHVQSPSRYFQESNKTWILDCFCAIWLSDQSFSQPAPLQEAKMILPRFTPT